MTGITIFLFDSWVCFNSKVAVNKKKYVDR